MGNPFRRANCSTDYHTVFCCAEEGQISGFDPLPRKIRCWSARKKAKILGGTWATFLNSGGGTSMPEIDVPSPTAGSKVLELSQKHHTSKRCMFTEFQASTFASTLTTFTPVAGLIFETKNRAIFLERFFGRGITAREQLSRAVILARF